MLASLPFLLAPGRSCPSSIRPHSMCVHAKAKIRNQQTSNGKKKMQRAQGRGIKQISMVDMASIAYGMRHDEPQDKQTNKKARRQTKGGVHKGQM